MFALTLILLVTLFVIIALPGLVVVARPRAAMVAVPFYLALLTGLFLYYFGLSFGGRMPAAAQPGQGPSNICEQALDQAEQGGLIIERSNPLRVRVSRALWEQLPRQAQQGLTACLEMSRPANAADEPVEIIEVGPRT